jgi:ADP-ribose pyrophosphatase YjhB (NUDIX family)
VAREPLSLHVIIVILVRRGFRYLLVRDDKRGSTWYPPAGQMQRGEDLLTAATRIARDRAGVEVQLTGIVSLMHMPLMPGQPAARMRFILEARLRNGVETDPGYPKAYYLPSEIDALELRGDDAAELIAAHSQGRPVAPIEIYAVGF